MINTLHPHTQASASRTRGVALIIAVVFLLAIVSIVVLGTSSALVRDLQIANTLNSSAQSYYLAESGTEDAYYRLIHNVSLPSSYTIPLSSNSANVSVVSNGINQKEITSTTAINSHTRSVETVLNTAVAGSVFGYGVQAGAGGITLGTNARIEGTGGASGDVYSNGPITGATNATITGNATVAGGTTLDPTAQMVSAACSGSSPDVGKSSSQRDYAQSFVPSASDALAKISLQIRRTSSSPSNATVYIVADNAGSPSTTQLASGTLAASAVGTSYAWVDVLMTTPPLLTAGTTYWIVINATQNSSKYWTWCRDNGSGYASGASKYSSNWSGGSWTSNTGDLDFKLYFGAGQSTLSTMIVSGTARANTITGSLISGDAYYQSISGSTIGGTAHPSSPDSSVSPFPLSDSSLATWRAVAATGGIISGNCPGATGCATTLGPVKINGNLTVASSGNLILSGIVYVTGNVTFGNNATISCDPAFGSDSCIFITDGYISTGTGVTISGSGTSGSYMLLISTISGCLGTTGSGCATGNSGIYLNSSTTGGVFYANKSLVTISGSAIPTTVIGYKISAANSATVRYPSGLPGTQFSTAPGGVWSVGSWKEE
jgi:hypothetical protein